MATQSESEIAAAYRWLAECSGHGASPFQVKIELNRRGLLESTSISEIAGTLQSLAFQQQARSVSPVIAARSDAPATHATEAPHRSFLQRTGAVLTAAFGALRAGLVLVARASIVLVKVTAAIALVGIGIFVWRVIAQPSQRVPTSAPAATDRAAPDAVSAARRAPWIGVRVENLAGEFASLYGVSPGHGAYITDVVPGSPAALANMAAGDIVLSVGGRAVHTAAEAMSWIAIAPIGRPLRIEIIRERIRYTPIPLPL